MSKVILMCADNTLLKRPLADEIHTAIIYEMLTEQGIEAQNLGAMSSNEAQALILKEKPLYLGIAINYIQSVSKLIEFLRKLRSFHLESKIIMYGIIPTISSNYIKEQQEIIHLVDYIIQGEPELTFIDLIFNKCSDDLLHVGRTVVDLNQLPYQRFSSQPELNTMITRGCFNNCLFCSGKKFYKTYRYRSVQHVVDEIESFIKNNSYEEHWVFFSDLDFLAISTVEEEWLMKFTDEVKNRKLSFKFTIQTRADRIVSEAMKILKSIGLNAVAVGVESGSKRVLDIYNKNILDTNVNAQALAVLQELNIPYKVNFIMYEPSTTLEDIKNNIDFLKSIDFPTGTVFSQPPASSFDKLNILVNGDAFKYYKKIPGVELIIEDYAVSYEFLHAETNNYYQYIKIWREKASRFLVKLYKVLNSFIYEKQQSKELLKFLFIGHKFRRLDLNLMALLVEEPCEETIEKMLEKLNGLHHSLDRLIQDGMIRIDSEVRSLGFHGQLNYLLNNEYNTNEKGKGDV